MMEHLLFMPLSDAPSAIHRLFLSSGISDILFSRAFFFVLLVPFYHSASFGMMVDLTLVQNPPPFIFFFLSHFLPPFLSLSFPFFFFSVFFSYIVLFFSLYILSFSILF